MKHTQLSIQYVKYLFLLSALFFHCAPVSKHHNLSLVSRYSGAGSLPLVETSLLEGLGLLFHTFGDSISADTISYLWNTCRKKSSQSFRANTEPLIENIPTMAAVLKNSGYSVATLQPTTYESLYALSKLPVLIWVIIIHHPDKKLELITEKNLTLYKTSILSPYAADIQLHLIKMIKKSDDGYKVTMHDGLMLHGLASDNLNAQILSGEYSTTAQYLQIVDCFIVSLLPMLELSEHIAEWYSAIPYKYVKPKIQEIN